MGQLRRRVITSVVAVPLIICALTLFGGYGLSLIILALVVLGVVELRNILKEADIDFYWLLVIVLGCLYAILAGQMTPSLHLLAPCVLAIFCRGLLSKSEPRVAVMETAYSILAFAFVPYLCSFALHTASLSFPTAGKSLGQRLVILLFIAVWSSDTAAYFVGKAWGRRKAIERISPNKTVEGFLGAVLGGALGSFVFSALFISEMGLAYALALGALIGVSGQLGDICVSLFKRAAKAKDAGSLLPGHGGVLDRMDSFLFGAPVTYLFAKTFLTQVL